MNNEEKILDLIEKVYIELQSTKKELNEKIDSVGNRLSRIEVEHGQKLDALFDGHKLNSEKLDRIEAKVSKHEEIIIKKSKIDNQEVRYKWQNTFFPLFLNLVNLMK